MGLQLLKKNQWYCAVNAITHIKEA